MATISELLTLDLVLDATGFSRGLRQTERDSQKFAGKLNRASDKASKGFVGAFRRMRKVGGRTFSRLTRGARGLVRAFGSIQVALAGIGVGLAAKELSAAASRFEETESKFTAVFKEGATEQRILVEEFGQKVGRSTTELLQFQATLQDTFVPLGIAREQSAELADQVTKLAIDIASFNNKVDADVVRDLQSALVGNVETVRKYGIVINQARINQELLNMGITGGVKAATEGEKALARLALITRGSTDALGDAIRTADSFENSMKRIKSAVLDASVAFGKELNVQILKSIKEAGGLAAILALVKLGFKAVAEAGKVAVRILGSYVEATNKVVGNSNNLEASLLGIEDIFRRVEITVRSFLLVLGSFGLGLTVVISGIILWNKVLFFLANTVFTFLTAAVAKFTGFFVARLGDVTSALAAVTGALGDTFLSKQLDAATISIRALQAGIDGFGDSVFTIEEVKKGLKELGATAKEIGSTIKAVTEIGVLSQTRGIDKAILAIGEIEGKQDLAGRRERRRRNRANKRPTAAEAIQTAREEVEGQARLFVRGQELDISRFNRAAASTSAVAAPSSVQNIKESNVTVDIGEIKFEVPTGDLSPEEAARLLGEELQRQIRTGQIEPFAEGPR